MNWRLSFTGASIVFLVLAAALVTAASQTATTPLYILRMEQESSRMSFLPAAVNGFTYATAQGYQFSCSASGCYVNPLDLTSENLCIISEEGTCHRTCITCNTCLFTCPQTCDGFTCDTCIATCGDTCNPTCSGITCGTCGNTCYTCSSCELTCSTC